MSGVSSIYTSKLIRKPINRQTSLQIVGSNDRSFSKCEILEVKEQNITAQRNIKLITHNATVKKPIEPAISVRRVRFKLFSKISGFGIIKISTNKQSMTVGDMILRGILDVNRWYRFTGIIKKEDCIVGKVELERLFGLSTYEGCLSQYKEITGATK